MSIDGLYIAYWSLRDPLTESQSLPVLRSLTRTGLKLALMTFEQEAWALSQADSEETRSRLLAEGIRWLPMRYHGRPSVFATLYDIFAGMLVATGATLCWKIRLLHGRGSVAAAIAYGASRLTGRRFFDDADGPLSEEYVDAGVWARGSVGHRLSAWGEARFLARADAVAVLTDRRRAEIASRSRVPVAVLPCAVDTNHFTPEPAARERLRRELRLAGIVLVYAGKSGGWYLTEAMLEFAVSAREVFGEICLLVLTPEFPERFSRPALERGLRVEVRRASRGEMPAYLSAADAGLSLVLSAPSKAAASPVKNGEYLACGLPVVTTPGIGDYSELLETERVGVVIESLDADGYDRAARRLKERLQDESLRARCRHIAKTRLDLQEVVVPRYFTIYRDLLGPVHGAT